MSTRSGITHQQLEIVRHLADGKRPGEIAKLVFTSKSAVDQQIASARSILNANTVAQLCCLVIAAGDLEWVDPEVGHKVNG